MKELPQITSDIEDVESFLTDEIQAILDFETIPRGLTKEAFADWLLEAEEDFEREPWHLSLSLRPLELERDTVERVRVQVADHSDLFDRDEICRTRLIEQITRLKTDRATLEVVIDKMLTEGEVIRLDDSGFVGETPVASTAPFTQGQDHAGRPINFM